MRTFKIDSLIARMADETGKKQSAIHRALEAHLNVSRTTLFKIRTSSIKEPYDLKFEQAMKLKEFFGLSKVDELINPVADRFLTKQIKKSHMA